MQFKDIIGQKDIIKSFVNTVQTNRISHAQLLYGPEGSGKLKLAIALAQYISCKNRTDEDSCGVCPSCNKYNKLIHPDLHFVFPVVKTKTISKPVSDNFIAEWRKFILETEIHRLNNWLDLIENSDAQAGIFTQESGEIIKKLSLKTFESEYKVMIIWLPEKMNLSSANKLLKMIEEPPTKTLFLMVSEYPDKVINTILSRAQFIKIPKIDTQSLIDVLKLKYLVTDENLDYIVKIANGNFFEALEAIKESDGQKYLFNSFVNLMRLGFSAKIVELTKWVDEITSLGREKQKEFIEYSLGLFRENFILNNLSEKSNELNLFTTAEKEFSINFNKFIHINNIFDIYEEFNKAHLHIERNGMGKIIFLDLALKLVKLLRRSAI
ncbi:MAG: DNA polymerase III subunit delta [Bacteroidales bacterium]|nr:DNA polymerase III subunit delta [Bacteroidales bacterium]MBN2756532.1 DNA polymerase III subunit delta [Bacteroidales bacterium]